MNFSSNSSQRYDRILFGGIVLLIFSALLGWSSRTVWVLAIMEVVILCLFLLFLTGLAKKEVKLPLSLKLFLFCSLLSVIFSVYRYNSIVGLVKIFLFIIAFWIVTQATKTIKQLNNLTIALSITALIASIYGIINFFQLHDITLGVASFFGWRNIFGGFILLFLPLVLTLYLTTNKKWEKYFLGLTTILLAVNFYFSFSQAAWLSFIVVFLGLIWFLRKMNKKQLILRLAIILVITTLSIILLPKLHHLLKPMGAEANLEQASSVQSLSIQNRLDYWKTSLEIFYHYPILGVGLGNFKTLYTHFQQNIWSFSVSPHNFFLLLLTEIGILGTLAFLIFVISLLRNGIKIIKQSRQNDHAIYYISIGLLGSLAASLIHNLFDLDWEVPVLLLIFFIEAGLIFSIKEIVSKESASIIPDSEKQGGIRKPLFSFILFIILGYLVIIPVLTDLWNERVENIQEDSVNSEQSIPILEKAASFNRLNADLYQNLSESYQFKILDHQGDREENQYLSVKYAQKAADFDPLSAERHFQLGYALNFVTSSKDEEIKKAETEIKKAIEYDQFNKIYYYQILAFVLERQEKYQEAIAVLDIPLALYSEDALNKIFVDEEKYNQILNSLEKIREYRDLIKQKTE